MWKKKDNRLLKSTLLSFNEVKLFYLSDEFTELQRLNGKLKAKILDLTSCGVVNNESYNEGGILKDNASKFQDRWVQEGRIMIILVEFPEILDKNKVRASLIFIYIIIIFIIISYFNYVLYYGYYWFWGFI